MTELQSMGAKAKAAARFLACAGPLKDKALLAMAQALEDCAPAILAANREDVEAARANGMSESLLDRLSLNEARIASMARSASASSTATIMPSPILNVLYIICSAISPSTESILKIGGIG